MKQCPRCGKWLNDQENFCTGCGSPLSSFNQPSRQPYGPSSPSGQGYSQPESYGRIPAGQNMYQNQTANSPNWANRAQTTGTKKKKGAKKALTITFSVLLCIALLVGGILTWLWLPGYLYERKIADAQSALDEGHYEKALKAAKATQKSKPEELKPYALAYEAALGMEDQEEKDEILSKAADGLTSSDQLAFDRLTDILDKDYAPDDPFVIIKEIGDLDMPPIELPVNGYNCRSYGWIIRQDGEYKYLDLNGKVHSPESVHADRTEITYANDASMASLYESASKYGFGAPLEKDKAEPFQVKKADYSDVASLYTLDESGQPRLVLESKSEYTQLEDLSELIMVTKEDLESAKKRAEQASEIDLINATAIDKAAAAMLIGQEYYLYDPYNHETFGPFDADEEACFGHQLLGDPTLSFQLVACPVNRQWAGSAFATKEEEENLLGETQSTVTLQTAGYTRDSIEGFDAAVFPSPGAIGGKRNGRLYMYYASLEPQYDGRFEEGGSMIQGSAPVKIDGTWKLVHFVKQDEERLTNTVTKLEQIKAGMKEHLRYGIPDILEAADDLLADLHPEYGSITVPQIYVDGIRYIPETYPTEPAEGSILIYDPNTWSITYAKESDHGNPVGETIQIIQNEKDEGKRDTFNVILGECDQNGAKGSVIEIVASKESDDIQSCEIYCGTGKNNLLDGLCKTMFWSYTSIDEFDISYAEGKIQPLEKMTAEESKLTGYDGYVVARDDTVFYSVPTASLNSQHVVFDTSVFGYGPLK